MDFFISVSCFLLIYLQTHYAKTKDNCKSDREQAKPGSAVGEGIKAGMETLAFCGQIDFPPGNSSSMRN